MSKEIIAQFIQGLELAKKRGVQNPAVFAMVYAHDETGASYENVIKALARKYGLNKQEQEAWVSNFEGLYLMQVRSGLTMSKFLKEYQSMIVTSILEQMLKRPSK